VGSGGEGEKARRISTRRVYEGKVLSLDLDEVEEPGGVHTRREVVRHLGSVAVLAIDDEGRIPLVRQYRYAVDDALWELPAGRLDPGESPEEAAQRELQEEIGFRAGSMDKISFFHTTPGFCDESMHLYRATRLQESKAEGDEDERIEVRSFTLDELSRMVDAGEVREGKTLVAILLELRRRAPAPPRGYL
jgi:ADP-ribose pyrophosphatase